MALTERILDEHSSSFLKRIDMAVKWMPATHHPDSEHVSIGHFTVEDLATTLGLASGSNRKRFVEAIANGERMGPWGIQKKETRNEIALTLARPFTTNSVVLHFPFADKWFPSVVHADGTVSQSLRCHENEQRFNHWAVRGRYTPDPMGSKKYPHALYMIFDWNRAEEVLNFAAIQRHELGKRKPEDPLHVLSAAERIRVHMSKIGDFSVPGKLSELEFFQNLIFPFRPLQMDIQKQVFRLDSMDDFFRVTYMPPKRK